MKMFSTISVCVLLVLAVAAPASASNNCCFLNIAAPEPDQMWSLCENVVDETDCENRGGILIEGDFLENYSCDIDGITCVAKDVNRSCTSEMEGDIVCASVPPIPTVSQWGLGVMVLLVLAGGTVILNRRRRLVAQA